MRKFLELKAKNAAKKAEKARKSAEAKAKYGNKFNELKAKNEERAKRKEEEKMKKKAQPVPDDAESSGTEWFWNWVNELQRVRVEYQFVCVWGRGAPMGRGGWKTDW